MAQLPIKMISAVFLAVLLFAVESVSAADFSRLKNQWIRIGTVDGCVYTPYPKQNGAAVICW